MNSQLTSLPMCGFIAQLVEHHTGIAEVTGSNPVEALIFFRLLYSNCLNWKFTAKITYPQFTYESFHIHYIIFNLVNIFDNERHHGPKVCAGFWIEWFQKISILPPQTRLEIPGRSGDLKDPKI